MRANPAAPEPSGSRCPWRGAERRRGTCPGPVLPPQERGGRGRPVPSHPSEVVGGGRRVGVGEGATPRNGACHLGEGKQGGGSQQSWAGKGRGLSPPKVPTRPGGGGRPPGEQIHGGQPCSSQCHGHHEQPGFNQKYPRGHPQPPSHGSQWRISAARAAWAAFLSSRWLSLPSKSEGKYLPRPLVFEQPELLAQRGTAGYGPHPAALGTANSGAGASTKTHIAEASHSPTRVHAAPDAAGARSGPPHPPLCPLVPQLQGARIWPSLRMGRGEAAVLPSPRAPTRVGRGAAAAQGRRQLPGSIQGCQRHGSIQA